ncbi:MAG: hypothetical protein R3C53_16775 [Pirellulaceae bacterium]
MPALFRTILDVCGPGWLAILCLAAAINLGVALRLTFRLQSVVALVAFSPIAGLPLWIGIVGSLVNLAEAIELGSDRAIAGSVMEFNVLVAMALLPAFVGAVLTLPAYVVATYGRFWLVTRSVGEVAKPTEDLKAAAPDADELAYQQYAESVAVGGYRRNKR